MDASLSFIFNEMINKDFKRKWFAIHIVMNFLCCCSESELLTGIFSHSKLRVLFLLNIIFDLTSSEYQIQRI